MAVIGLAIRFWHLFGSNRTAAGDWLTLRAFVFWLPFYLDWFALGMAMAVAIAWLGNGGQIPKALALLGHTPWLSWAIAAGCYWLVMQLGIDPFTETAHMSSSQAFGRYTFTGLAGAFFVVPAVFGSQGEGWIRALLRLPVMVALGLVSYGIYLWHVPIWELANEWRTDGLSVSPYIVVGLVFLATLAAAGLSYVIVERPIIFWSTGRAAPKLTNLNVDTLHAIGTASTPAPAAGDRPLRKVTSGHVTVALAIVVVAVTGLLLPGIVSKPDPSPAKYVDPYIWRGPGSTVWDSFDRPDQPGLGAATSGQTWTALSGTWSIARHRASASPNDTVSVAVVQQGVPGSATYVRAFATGTMSNDGIAFRCQDTRNCWLVEAVPQYKTWSIRKIVDGRVTKLGNIGSVERTPGTSISVHSNGDGITIAVNGVYRRALSDPALRDVTGVGIVRGAGGTRPARWSRFEADVVPVARP